MKKLMVMLLAAGAFAIGSLAPTAAVAQYENPKPAEATKAEGRCHCSTGESRRCRTRGFGRASARCSGGTPQLPRPRMHPSRRTSTRATRLSCTPRR